MRLYVITSKTTKKVVQGYYVASDLKAIIPYKQFLHENGKEYNLYEVNLKTGKLREIK